MATMDPMRIRDLSGDILGSITMMLEAYREKAALILIYAGIDIFGALDTDDGRATRTSFERWSETYLVPSKNLGCSGLELYSARCGLLHTMSAETDLTRDGRARQFVYITYPHFFPDQNVPGDTFVLHVGNFWQAFRAGTAQFLEDADADPARTARVTRNVGRLYFTQTTR